MIENFEQQTYNLTSEELSFARRVLKGLEQNYNSKQKAIKSATIVKGFKDKGFKFSGVRLRKIINALRQSGEPIIGTSKGYWYSNNRREIESCIRSLAQRRKAIEAAENGLIKSLNNLKL